MLKMFQFSLFKADILFLEVYYIKTLVHKHNLMTCIHEFDVKLQSLQFIDNATEGSDSLTRWVINFTFLSR